MDFLKKQVTDTTRKSRILHDISHLERTGVATLAKMCY